MERTLANQYSLRSISVHADTSAKHAPIRWAEPCRVRKPGHAARTGSLVSITIPAYAAMKLEGKVSYVGPQLNPHSRTALLRVEVPNPGSQLRLGMYAEMQVGEAAPEGVELSRYVSHESFHCSI